MRMKPPAVNSWGRIRAAGRRGLCAVRWLRDVSNSFSLKDLSALTQGDS